MIKIKKITPDLLKEGLTFNDYKKFARPLFNAVKKAHQGVDNQVEFFILTDFEFSDKPGKKTTIFVPGKQTNDWKKFLKDKFREDKKNVMIGKCYISGEAGKESLNLIPERGNAKMNIITKQGKRMFAMAKLSVQLASGAEEATNASGGRVNINEEELKKKEEEEQEETSTASTTTETTESTQEETSPQDKESLKEMLKEQLKGLAAKVPLIKEGFNSVKEVVQKYKSKEVSKTEETKLAGVLDTLKDFISNFEDKDTHKEVKKRMKDAYKKVTAQMPKIDALYKRLKEQVKQQEQEQQEKQQQEETSASTAGLDPEIIQELRQQMDVAKTAIDKLKKELDLDALLAEVS
jgi:hypothetical protein